jgi:hypothetical protein
MASSSEVTFQIRKLATGYSSNAETESRQAIRCKQARGFHPLDPRTGVPPAAKSLRGTRSFVPRSDIASGGSPVGVEGAKPLAFLSSHTYRHWHYVGASKTSLP